MSKITGITGVSSERRQPVVDGPEVPKLEIDGRFGKAFPEQAEMLRKFSRDMIEWWRNTKIETPE